MTQRSITTTAVALMMLTVVLWLAFGRGEQSAPSHAPELPVADDTDRQAEGENSAAAKPAAAAANDGATRLEVTTEPPQRASTTGTLVVHAIWQGKNEPAQQIAIFVSPRAGGTRPRDSWRQQTDDEGIARFVDLPAVSMVVSANRGTRSSSVVTIEEGQEVELQLELAVGVTATGTVVDPAQVPVAGADIVVASWAANGATVLTQSDREGRFELRGIGANSSVGARAPGFAPSLLQGLTSKPGGSLEIHIVLPGVGGGLLCTVLDPEGALLHGAIVRAGIEGRQSQPKQMADGSWGSLIPQQQRTDEHGRVSFFGVAEGEAPVAAWFDGYSPWRGTARVDAGSATKLTVQLQLQASLVGTVRDARNNPHPDVAVIVGRDGTLASAYTRTDTHGSYRIDGIAIGEFRAEVQGNGVYTVTTLTGVPGQTVRWDPDLPATEDLPGRLLGPNGAGVANSSITGSSVNARTDQQGRFTLENVARDKSLRLKVQVGGSLFPTEVYDSLPPITGELTLHLREDQMPSVRFVGKLVDPDGVPFTNASLSPQMRSHGNTYGLKTEEDGRFDFGPYPPGEYRLLVRAKGWAKVSTPWRHLQPGEIVDFGMMQLESPGALVVQLTGGAMPAKVTFPIYNASGGHCGNIPIIDGHGQVGGLGGGDYRMQIRGKGVAAAIMPFTVRSGGETRLDVPARTGVPVTFSIVWPDRATSQRIDLVVMDRAGSRVIHTPAAYVSKKGIVSGSFSLTPGRYRAVASAGEGRGTHELVVTAAGGSVAIHVN